MSTANTPTSSASYDSLGLLAICYAIETVEAESSQSSSHPHPHPHQRRNSRKMSLPILPQFEAGSAAVVVSKAPARRKLSMSEGFKIEECHICGRNFKGPKASTHKQQHIRRLHPKDYIPKRGGKKRVIPGLPNYRPVTPPIPGVNTSSQQQQPVSQLGIQNDVKKEDESAVESSPGNSVSEGSTPNPVLPSPHQLPPILQQHQHQHQNQQQHHHQQQQQQQQNQHLQHQQNQQNQQQHHHHHQQQQHHHQQHQHHAPGGRPVLNPILGHTTTQGVSTGHLENNGPEYTAPVSGSSTISKSGSSLNHLVS